jgi:hypothetical protein
MLRLHMFYSVPKGRGGPAQSGGVKGPKGTAGTKSMFKVCSKVNGQSSKIPGVIGVRECR